MSHPSLRRRRSSRTSARPRWPAWLLLNARTVAGEPLGCHAPAPRRWRRRYLFWSPTPTGSPTSSSCLLSDRGKSCAPGRGHRSGAAGGPSRSRAGRRCCPGREPTESGPLGGGAGGPVSAHRPVDRFGLGQGAPQPWSGEAPPPRPKVQSAARGLRLGEDEGGVRGGDHEVAQVQVSWAGSGPRAGWRARPHPGGGRGGWRRRPSIPVSSRASRRATSSPRVSPGSACPPGCSHRSSLR